MTKKNKAPSFLEMFNKIKDTNHYRDRMAFWSAMKASHKFSNNKITFNKTKFCFQNSEDWYQWIVGKNIPLTTIKDLYNYLFPNVKKSKN